jgi:CheY-like chemotaxis protein
MKQKLNCVLLIDDDEPTNFLSNMFIEDANCSKHIETTQSGQEALKYLSDSLQAEDKSGPYPDLIFLDINMPAMDGWEFLDKYKNLKKEDQQKVVIIMLTTSLNPDDALKAYESPEISGFENKPITNEKLDKILKKYFADYFVKDELTENNSTLSNTSHNK